MTSLSGQWREAFRVIYQVPWENQVASDLVTPDASFVPLACTMPWAVSCDWNLPKCFSEQNELLPPLDTGAFDGLPF